MMVKQLSKFVISCDSSFWQFYDFHPDVGLIVAGGRDHARKVDISTDNGKTKTSLPDLPYGTSTNNAGLHRGCLVIINTTTVFVAGGES